MEHNFLKAFKKKFDQWVEAGQIILTQPSPMYH